MGAVSKEEMGTDIIDVKMSSQVITFDVTEAAIQKLDEKYADGSMVISDTKTYKAVVAGIAEVRGYRLKVEARRKELKADALEHGRNIDSKAKQIATLLAPIEARLNAVKQVEDDRKAEAKAELAKIEQDRVDGIREKITGMLNMTTGLLSLDSEQAKALLDEIALIEIDMAEYMEFTQEAMDVKGDILSAAKEAMFNRIKLDEEEAARKAEDERLQKVREDQEAEAKRLADANKKLEDERLAIQKKFSDEQVALNAERKAADDKLAEERRLFEEEKAKVEADRKSEQEKKEREEFEAKAKETAVREAEEKAEADRIQAEIDAKAKAKMEEEERVEREAEAEAELKRAEALRPDKEKMAEYINAIDQLPIPEVTSDTAQALLNDICTDLSEFRISARKAIETM